MATNTIAGIPSHKGTEQIEPASANPQAFLVAAQIPPATATSETIIVGSPTANNGGSVMNTEPKTKPIAPPEIVNAPAIVGFHVCSTPTDSESAKLPTLVPQFLQNLYLGSRMAPHFKQYSIFLTRRYCDNLTHS
jgi:hypothetical protein